MKIKFFALLIALSLMLSSQVTINAKGDTPRGFAGLGDNNYSEVYKSLRDSHVNVVRTNGYWNNIEWYKGSYQWGTISENMKQAADNGMDVLYMAGYWNPNYYTYVDGGFREVAAGTHASDTSGDKITMGSPQEIEGYVNYVKACIEKYPQIKYLEVWNEPNASNFWRGDISPENYKKMLKAVATMVREVRPDIEIVIGATSNNTDNSTDDGNDYYCMDWKEFIGAITTEDMYPYYDAISLHPYNNNKGATADSDTDYTNDGSGREAYKAALNLMRSSGGFKKIYITETGGYSGTETYHKNEKQKGYEMVKQYVICDEFGMDGSFVYSFVNAGTDSANTEHNYGVITHSDAGFKPLDGYYSVKQFLSIANNADYIGKLNLKDGLAAHVYMHSGEPVVVMWSSSTYSISNYTAYYSVSYSFSNPVAIKDVHGIDKATNTTNVTVGEAPVYVYGMDRSAIKDAAINLANERIGYLKVQYPALSLANIAELATANDVYTAIDTVYNTGRDFIKAKSLDSKAAAGFADSIDGIASALINSLAGFDDAKRFDYADLQKAYVNYKMTLDTLDYDNLKYADGIKKFGLDTLTKVSGMVESRVCVPSDPEDEYVLNRYGELEIAGENTPGSLVTVKVMAPNGNLVFLNTVTTDYSGKYKINCKINREFGDYKVYINEGKAALTEITVPYIEDNYFPAEERILFGEVIRAENLLELSRTHLFTYSDMPEDKKLLVDVYWMPEDKQANALYSIKNIGDTFIGQIAICGYNKDNELISINLIDDLSIEKDKYIEETLNITYSERPHTLKAFIWRDMTPLSLVYEY